MHNSNIEDVIRNDKRITDCIKNYPDRAPMLLLDDYRLSQDKTAFVAALIGALCVEKARNKFGVSR